MQQPDWYRDAVIYALDVSLFFDADGDGHGDFEGARRKLDYIQELGVDCLWLLPFFRGGGRDNDYDVIDHKAVDPQLGTLDQCHALIEEADRRGIRVIIDLVANHTSDQHPWFREAMRDPHSPYRDYYVWSDEPVETEAEPIFAGVEDSVWEYAPEAGQYYFHRFYHFEPDLNNQDPAVRQELQTIVERWLELPISGFRVDAAPHLVGAKGAMPPAEDHGPLRDLRATVDRIRPGAILLGEVDKPAGTLQYYHRAADEEMQVLFNFLLNNSLWLAFARQEAGPIRACFEGELPDGGPGQWANFVRNLDELDLERLSEHERQEVYEAFAPEEHMRSYGRGIRRRLAPMFHGDQRRIELAHSLLLSLPGTPVIVYGDEIGMGENLDLAERNAVRLPMQWDSGLNGGFSDVDPARLHRPMLADGPFGYRQVNVREQASRPDSLLSRLRGMLHERRRHPGIGSSRFRACDADDRRVLVHRVDGPEPPLLFVHNLADAAIDTNVALPEGTRLQPIIEQGVAHSGAGDVPCFALGPYGHAWYAVLV